VGERAAKISGVKERERDWERWHMLFFSAVYLEKIQEKTKRLETSVEERKKPKNSIRTHTHARAPTGGANTHTHTLTHILAHTITLIYTSLLTFSPSLSQSLSLSHVNVDVSFMGRRRKNGAE